MKPGTRKKLLAVALALGLTAFLWLPGAVYAATGQIDRYQYYLSALEYGLKGLSEYFRFVIELFKVAITT